MILFSFFLPISSFYLFLRPLLGLNATAPLTSLYGVAHFFRLFDVANPFTQTNHSYSVCFIDGTWIRDIFLKNQSCTLMQMYFIAHQNFLVYAELNPGLLKQIFTQQMLFLWASQPQLHWFFSLNDYLILNTLDGTTWDPLIQIQPSVFLFLL